MKRCSFNRLWAFLALALAPVALATTVRAQEADLVGADAWSLSGDLRAVFADGEKSWTERGFGKLRFGDETGLRLGHVDLVWQPRFGWSTSATVAGSLQEVGGRLHGGISEAFLSVRSKPGAGARPSLRAGLMWPPVSLEHEGADWHVADTLTPSAINSWIGEEVRPLAIEGKLDIPFGGHRFEATAAIFAANDTAGALLTFRGWALHDLKALDGRRWPLPKLSEEADEYQPRYSHPLLDVLPGFAKRPGFYAKLAWSPPAPVRVELFHYDNSGDPEAANENREWAWDTRFDQAALILRASEKVSIKAQAMKGRTEMGLSEAGRVWFDGDFRSAFALATYDGGSWGAALRGEAFDVRQRGSLVDPGDTERGWAATIAAHRTLSPHTALWLEALHVGSRRDARLREADVPRQPQNQLQVALRGTW